MLQVLGQAREAVSPSAAGMDLPAGQPPGLMLGPGSSQTSSSRLGHPPRGPQDELNASLCPSPSVGSHHPAMHRAVKEGSAPIHFAVPPKCPRRRAQTQALQPHGGILMPLMSLHGTSPAQERSQMPFPPPPSLLRSREF